MKKRRTERILAVFRGLKKEKNNEKKNRLHETQARELEDKRNSHKSFYRDALEFLQDEVKKYWGKLKY